MGSLASGLESQMHRSYNIDTSFRISKTLWFCPRTETIPNLGSRANRTANLSVPVLGCIEFPTINNLFMNYDGFELRQKAKEHSISEISPILRVRGVTAGFTVPGAVRGK